MDLSSIAQSASGVNSVSRKGIAQDFDKFLYLLTQQLKNQDPLQPMETSEFTNQLVQFANVEQNIKSNENLQSIIDLQERNAAVGAVGYIGKEIEVVGNKLPLVDGQSKFKYSLPETAEAMRIEIRDGKGVVIRELEGPKTAGSHELTWDGKDRFGVPVAEGSYSVSVTAAKNNNGVRTPIEVAIGTLGRVTGLINLDGKTNVVIGNAPYKISDIVRVREYTAPAPVVAGNNTPDAPAPDAPVDRNDDILPKRNYEFIPYDQQPPAPPLYPGDGGGD
jgi:flagellar basal-body rod modification protein FlgD